VRDPEFIDSFELFKEIIKELLFNGADRRLETNENATALDLLEEYKEMPDNCIDDDDDMLADYYKLRGILIGNSDC